MVPDIALCGQRHMVAEPPYGAPISSQWVYPAFFTPQPATHPQVPPPHQSFLTRPPPLRGPRAGIFVKGVGVVGLLRMGGLLCDGGIMFGWVLTWCGLMTSGRGPLGGGWLIDFLLCDGGGSAGCSDLVVSSCCRFQR